MTATLRPVLQLARRSVVATYRQPAMVFPSLFFPLMMAALNSAAMGRSTALPGFPEVDSFLDFMLATTVIQGVLFGSVSGGSLMAVDIQDGFFDRLVASPVPRWTIVVGRLAGAGVLGSIQSAVFIVVLTVFGASVKGGLASVVAIVLVAFVLAIALGGMGVALALRTGSAEAVQACFPIFFMSLFVSSAFFPRELMTGLFRRIADVNPMSDLIDAVRRLVIAGFSVTDTAQALVISIAIGVFTVTLSAWAMRWRLGGAAA